jgi:hypothetical protein
LTERSVTKTACFTTYRLDHATGFGLTYAEMTAANLFKQPAGNKVSQDLTQTGGVSGGKSEIGYLMDGVNFIHPLFI